jgi:hypothetical protein
MASDVMQKLAGLDGKRALFLGLVIGFPIGPVKIAGVALGNVTEQALALVATLRLGASQ